jgi:magnesium-transporting ATPase (P-type)
VIRQIAWTTLGFIAVFALFEIPFVRAMFATPETYMSARFALLVIMAIVNGFCVRTNGFNLLRGLRQNPMFVMVALGVIGSTILCVTFGGAILQLVPMSLHQWLVVGALSLMIIPINWVRKRFAK